MSAASAARAGAAAAPPLGPRSAWLAPAALFAAAIALLFAPAILGSAQFLYRDSGRLHAPMKRWIASELSAGRFPTWNPYEAMGTSLATDPIHAVQHPFNLLLLLLPFDAAFKGWILASYLVAALGTFAWTRRLGAGREGATLAGLAYALSGFLVSSSDNVTYLTTAALAPWVLAAGHAFVARPAWGRLAPLLVASWLCAASGDPLTWAIAVALVPALAVLLSPVPRRTALLRGIGGAAAAVLAAAPILLPLAHGLSASARADAVDDVARRLWDLHPLRLLEVLVPHLSNDPTLDTSNEILRVFTGTLPTYGPWVLSIYTGLALLLLAAAGARTSRTPRLLLAVAAILTWCSMGHYAGFGQLARHLPFLTSLRYWEKLFVWPTLLLAAAAGLGGDALLSGRIAPRAVVRIAGAAAAVAAVLLAVTYVAPLERWLRVAPDAATAAWALAANLRSGSLQAFAVAAALAAGVRLLLVPGRERRAGLLLVAVAALDLVAANVRAYRLAPPTDRLPPSALRERLRAEPGIAGLVSPFELQAEGAAEGVEDLPPWAATWRRGQQTLDPCWNVPDHVRNASPYSALYPRRYARFEAVPLERRVPALGLFGFGYVAVPGEPSLLARTELRPPWDVAARDPYGTLVSVPHRPRAYLAASARTATPEGALAFASDPGSIPSPETLVEGPVPPGLAGGRAEIVEDLPASVRVRTESSGPSLLVLNDAFASGWTATVDGEPAEILAANYLARAVVVKTGAHEVRFRYRVPLLAAGWAVALLLLAATGVGAFFERRRRGGSEADMQTLPDCKD